MSTEPKPALPEPGGWLIQYFADGAQRSVYCGHNSVGDYRGFDPKATSRPIYTADQMHAFRAEGVTALLDSAMEAVATERAAREAAVREVARLTACLLTANSNHEEFERRYYLEADRVEAAQMESVLLHSAINRACAGYPENSAAPTCVQILRAALAPQADPSVRPSVHPAESPVEGERRDGEAS